MVFVPGISASVASEQNYKEQREDGYSFVLGGKVLVIDIVFVLSRTPNGHSVLDIATVKSSHALLPQQSFDASIANQDFGTLDQYIKDTLLAFAKVVQNDHSSLGPLKAAGIAKDIQAFFEYLMKLDELSNAQGDGGIQWFDNVSTTTSVLSNLMQSECAAVAR